MSTTDIPDPNTMKEKFQNLEQDELRNPTDIYLREIGATPLLSKEEEIYYARLALKGDEKASHRLITSNLRLVVKIARRYLRCGMPILDLIAEGNLGLIRAVEKFNPELGFRFSTYGAWWIQQTIERAIMNQNRTIRLPVHIMKRVNQCLKTRRMLARNLDHEPTVEEIAQSSGGALSEIQKLMMLNERVVSMDNPISAEINKPMVDMLAAHERDDPFYHLTQLKLQAKLSQWLSHLSPKQRAVVERRYGLNGYHQMTLNKTGSDVGLTKERVRQLQSDALKALKVLIQKQGNDLNTLLG
jgi:RNA polymerase nonessential primary-like sigma factor